MSVFEDSPLEDSLSFLINDISIIVCQEAHLVDLLAVVIKQYILLILASFQSRLARRIHFELSSHFPLVELGETKYFGDFSILQ